MRYLPIFVVVVHIMMTGVLHTAELPQPETAMGPEEEPPQRTSGTTLDMPAPAPDGMPAAPAPAPIVSPDISITTNLPTNPEPIIAPEQPTQAPIDEASTLETPPTIEDAERVEEEATHSSVSMPSPAPFDISFSALPAAPPTHEAAQSAQDEMPEPPRGIDTVDLEQPQGNWLFKRYWWERAEELYKKIRAAVEKINDSRMKFFARRTELDKTILNPFYTDVGLTQGELHHAIQSLMQQLVQEQEREGMLNETERELKQETEKEKERLEQLSRDIQAIGTLHEAADKVIERITEQKNRVSQYETETLNSMGEIGRIVNDTKASELYYRMDAHWRTVKEIQKYIDQDLNRYFEKLLANAREQTERIKTALQALKEQGVDLKMRIQEAQAQEIQKELVQEEEEKNKKVPKPEKTGWFATTSRLYQAVIDVALWQFLQSIWDVLMWLPRRIYGTFTSLFR